MLSRAFQAFTKFMHEEFWLFLLASIGAAFVFPDFGSTYLKPLALPAILAQMYVVMLNVEPAQLLTAFRAWRPLLRALALIFLVTPLTAYLGGFFLPPALLLGMAVVCSMPSGMSSSFFTEHLGGSAALAIVITTLSHLLVPLIAPVVVKVIAGGVLDVDPMLIFIRLVQLVLLPFLGAWVTRKALGPARTASFHRAVGWMGGVFVIIVTWGIVADITAVEIPLTRIVAVVLGANGLLFVLGYLWGAAEKVTISTVAGYRNVTLGMVLASSVWTDPVVAAPSIVWTLTHNLYAVSFLLFRRLRRA